MRRHRQEMGPLTEINVTNLLDTCFVLLMAFMVVAPAKPPDKGVKVNLPAVSDSGPIESDAKKTMTVQVAKSGVGGDYRIMVDGKYLTAEALAKDVKRMKESYPKMDVIMEVDKDSSFQTFAEAITSIKTAGVDDIGIMTIGLEDAPPPPAN